MKKTIAKLLTAGLSLALFASCANAVSNENGWGEAIIAMEESFPLIDTKADRTDKIIKYDDVSLTDANKFEQSLKTKKFLLDNTTYYNKNITYQNTQYVAVVDINFVEATKKYAIVLTIVNTNGDVDADAFNNIFGRINGSFFFASIIRYYGGDITPYLQTYEVVLRHKYGFKQDKNNVVFTKNSDNFTYQYSGAFLSKHSMAIWNIEKTR
jgi:hypothetical protein